MWSCFQVSESKRNPSRTALGSRVTDVGLCALAAAGCGANLSVLCLDSEFFFTHGSGAHLPSRPLSPSFVPLFATRTNNAGLSESITDKGLVALSEAGCGPQLTVLLLESECFVVTVSALHAKETTNRKEKEQKKQRRKERKGQCEKQKERQRKKRAKKAEKGRAEKERKRGRAEKERKGQSEKKEAMSTRGLSTSAL